MAKTFERLWGPSGRKTDRARITWNFLAVWQDGKGQRYRLVYDALSRRWTTRRVTKGTDQSQVAAYCDSVPLGDDARMVTGRTVTEMLRSCLTDDDRASAAALSLTIQR